MRRVVFVLIVAALAGAGCSSFSSKSQTTVQIPASCAQRGDCVNVTAALDGDGNPANAATVIVAFNGTVRTADINAVRVLTPRYSFETESVTTEPVPVRGFRVDPRTPNQVVVDLGGLIAEGSTIIFGPGALQTKTGAPVPEAKVPLRGLTTPFGVALATTVWDPEDPSIFGDEGIEQPAGVRDDQQVREELESRLRLRTGISESTVEDVLAKYDSEQVRQRVPDHRLRAGLLMLTGTSGEYAIQFILADTNRRGVPFEPVEARPLVQYGALAAVFYHPLEGKLRMYIDTTIAEESLENLAVIFAHETLHSDLGGGSVVEETLAMGVQTRIYQEFLNWDPGIALNPTESTRWFNQLTLALRNSGSTGFPRAGLLPRPGVDDVLRGTGREPARSFRDLLVKPDFYGDIPRAGDNGSEVLEAYYRRVSGDTADQGRLRYDQTTLKLFDRVLDHGLSDHQIIAVAKALRLRPTPIQ